MISLKSGVSLALAALALAGCGGWIDERATEREVSAEHDYPPEGQFIDVGDGRRVHAVVRGKGPDLVLIHGASGNTHDFTFSFVDRLTDRYRVIVFDRPGMGYTDRARPGLGGPYETDAESPAEQAAMLNSAARALGATRPIVLGHSYGGAVAMAWGLNHSPAALVIVSGATQPWPGRLDPMYGITASTFGSVAIVPMISAFATEGQIDGTLKTIFYPQPVPEGYAESIGAGLSLRRESFRANARQLATLKPHLKSMSPRYSELEIPVEIIHGAKDTIVPAKIHAIPLHEDIEGSGLTIILESGHMPHHVAPDAVVEAIDRAARRAGLR